MKNIADIKKVNNVPNTLLIVFLATVASTSQAQNCYDIGFETGMLSSWTTAGTASIVSAGTDTYGSFAVSAPGGNFSVKLGSETDPTPSTISKSFVVSASSPIITYNYAMVLQNAPHPPDEAARVVIDVLDNTNTPIACGHYEAFAAPGGPSGFLPSNQPDVSYKPWSPISLDLTPYIGQTVTLSASVTWCSFNFHWAYVYLDFGCANYPIKQDTACNTTGTLLIAPENFEEYGWTGPGIISGQSNDSVYVSQVGIYTVSMVSATGCVFTLSDTVTTIQLPVVAVASGAGSICRGDSITLSASGGSTYLWWNTANTTNSMTVSPTSTTTYTVEVKNSQGCTDTASVTVVLNPQPSADFSPNDVCLGQAINFTNLSTILSGSITAWSWNFGDQSLIFIQSPSHFYSSIGTYPTKLIVTSDKGCKDTIVKNVVVHPIPDALFASENACQGNIISFNDLSTISGSDIVQAWSWDFGDGTPLKNNQNTSHLYPNAGSYDIELIVTSNFGCKDSLTHTVVVSPSPIVSFSAIDTVDCSPFCVRFESLVTNAGNRPLYEWNYGATDEIDNATNGYYCYENNTSAPLSFDVSLTVTSDSGCVSSFNKNDYIVVNPVPVADFSAQPESVSILEPTISFANLSSGDTGWSWDFGDLTSSTDQSPQSHTYADTGKYNVSLIVSNPYSCFDTAYKTITIEPDWAFFIPNVFTPNADGINDTFQGYGYGLLEYTMLIFDRWGDQIYATESYDAPWDGRANYGKTIAQQDVYVYQFIVKDVHGYKHIYTGVVTLVR